MLQVTDFDGDEGIMAAAADQKRVLRPVPGLDSNDAATASIDAIMEKHTGTGSSSSDGSGLPDKETLAHDVTMLQARLRRMNRGLLNPTGKYMQ